MDEPLTGLGLFTRAGPHLTSIAVNLGLHASAPMADRPWACRVSTVLAHPDPDGLARNVAEIERLAALGRAVVEQSAGVFAAAVTTQSTRAWLVYLGGTDEATVAAAAEAGVARAFAGHPGYVPTMTVTSDVGWGGYLSLYPTADEADDVRRRRAESDAVAAARSATQANIRSLRAAGVDLTRPSPVRYAVSFPAGAVVEPFVQQVAAAGLRPDSPAGDGSLTWVREDLPDLALILRTERWLIHEARRAGGRYDGWTAAA